MSRHRSHPSFAAAAFFLLAATSVHADPTCQPEHLHAGRAAVCAIRGDGQASCWADYFDNFDTYYLIHRRGTGELLEISVGYDRSCAIRTDHTVECWYGYGEQSLIDAAPAPDGEFSRLSLSFQYNDDDSCGLRTDGTLVCWQNDDPSVTSTPAEGTFVDFSGSCGLREDHTVDCIGDWTPPDGTFASLATASYPACGLREDGEIACWVETGEDTSTWINGPPEGSFKQVSVHSDDPRGGCAINLDDEIECWGGFDSLFQPPEGTFTEVVAGNRRPCALRTDGTVICWPQSGPLTTGPLTPVVGPFVHVGAGGDAGRRQSTCAIRANAGLTCWGNNEHGQSQPPDGAFASVAVGAYHACGLREDGHIQCWGDNFYGKQIEAPSGLFSQISAGLTHTCALRIDGTIACWGIGSTSLAVPGGEFTQVTAGGIDACGLRTNGHVECWSYGDGITIDTPTGTFESITSSGHGVSLAGYRHLGCGIRPNKTIECWGNADFGLLDPPEGEFTSVSAGGEQACAVGTDGEVVCWGHGYGDEPSIFHVPPGPFVEVEAGYYHACGLRPDATVSCWGLDRLESLCGAPPTCGNGVREQGEVCEQAEGGFAPGDPCNARCFTTPCGQPVNAEAFEPRISDALFVLQTSVQLKSCGNFVCDVNVDTVVDVADALLIMQRAVHLPVELRCARSKAVGGIVKEWEPCPFSPAFCQLM